MPLLENQLLERAEFKSIVCRDENSGKPSILTRRLNAMRFGLQSISILKDRDSENETSPREEVSASLVG